MAKGKKKSKVDYEGGIYVKNRKAWHDYNVLEKVECGIVLIGTEVKSMRLGNAKIDEGYARIREGEVFLVGANFGIYPQAAMGMQHEPTRDRKLLLHKRQVLALEVHARQKGKTIIPLAMYFKRGWAKVELGIAVGKRQHDKRQAIKDRDIRRDMARQMGRR